MKEKVMIFIIGLLLGSIISTSAFVVYSKTSSCNNHANMSGGTPPSSSNNQNSQNGQPPEMPNNNNSQSENGTQSSN